MKKLTALFLILALTVAALTGCSGNQTTEAPTNATEETTAPVTEATTAAPSDQTSEAPTTAAPDDKLDYSKYLDDYGYIEGVKASDLIPEIDYTTVKVSTANIREDAENAVESVIANLTGQYSAQNKERAVKDGDTLNMEYKGKTKDDGVYFEGGSTDSADVTIGVTSYIDGFLPQLIGHKPGEEFEIEVTFPDPYSLNTDLSGKVAIFEIKIHYITESPEFDDDFVKAHWDTISTFPDVKEGMTAAELKQAFYDYYYDYYISSEVYTAVGSLKMDVEVPETVLKYVENADNCTYMEQYGVSFTDLLSMYGYSEEKVKEIFTEEGTRELIFQAYYERAGWKVEESEYKEATQQDDNAESIEKLGRGYIARYVMLERALNELKDKVTFVDEETSDK